AVLGDLLPSALRPEQIMGEIAAVAVRHGRQNVLPIMRFPKCDLCYPREVFAYRVSVCAVGRPDLMKINLLIKIQISIRPLAFPRKASVINSAAIPVPRRASAGRGILHMRNRVR